MPRPVVEPELFASLRPPTYSGDMNIEGVRGGKGGGFGKGDAAGAEAKAPAPAKKLQEQMKRLNRTIREEKSTRALADAELGDDMDLKKGVASAATATEMGDFFQYLIDQPVNLPRQK